LGSREPYDPEAYVERVQSAEDSGAEYYLTTFLRGEGFIDSMRGFAEEVMPSFK